MPSSSLSAWLWNWGVFKKTGSMERAAASILSKEILGLAFRTLAF
jgi:hypothetical protein